MDRRATRIRHIRRRTRRRHHTTHVVNDVAVEREIDRGLDRRRLDRAGVDLEVVDIARKGTCRLPGTQPETRKDGTHTARLHDASRQLVVDIQTACTIRGECTHDLIPCVDREGIGGRSHQNGTRGSAVRDQEAQFICRGDVKIAGASCIREDVLLCSIDGRGVDPEADRETRRAHASPRDVYELRTCGSHRVIEIDRLCAHRAGVHIRRRTDHCRAHIAHRVRGGSLEWQVDGRRTQRAERLAIVRGGVDLAACHRGDDILARRGGRQEGVGHLRTSGQRAQRAPVQARIVRRDEGGCLLLHHVLRGSILRHHELVGGGETRKGGRP